MTERQIKEAISTQLAECGQYRHISVTDAATDAAPGILKLAEEDEKRLRRATELLREWRDKYAGREHYSFPSISHTLTVSPTDLIRETQRFLEGR